MDRLLWHGSVNLGHGSTNECHRQHMFPPPTLLMVLSFLPLPPRDRGAQQDAGSTQLAPSPEGHPSTPYLGPKHTPAEAGSPWQHQRVPCKGHPRRPAELHGARLQEDNVSLFSAFRKWFMGHN